MDFPVWGTVSHQRLKENITLLWLLGREPGEPAENHIPQRLREETLSFSRRLTIERERDLVDTLAFISASSEGPEDVIAVCVEEHEGQEGMTFRVAANRGDLQPRIDALRRIASILECVASEGNFDKNSSALIREIIALNRDRIFSRLRSTHALPSIRNRNKNPTIALLAEAVKALKGLASNRLKPSREIEDVETKMEELQALYGRLESMTERQVRSDECYGILEGLARVAYSLTSEINLSQLLSSIPNTGRLGPDGKSSLSTAVGKLGRYYSSCPFLIAAARKVPTFKVIRVEGVRLPVSALLPYPIAQPEPSLSATVSQILGTEAKTLGQTISIDLASAEAKFRRRLAESPRSYKIHAEIQLLFFYEIHTDLIRPRVICSSKSACFLCDLFINLHAKFYIARTHGVIWDKWKLPDQRTTGLRAAEMTAMATLVEQFNTAVEDRIKSTLATPRLRRFHPNESVFLEPPVWSPTSLSLATKMSSQVDDHSSVDESAVREVRISHGRSLTGSTPQCNETDPGRTSKLKKDTEQDHVGNQPKQKLNQPMSTLAIHQHPSRNNSQADVSGKRDSKSNASGHSMNASSPLRCPDAVTPGYQLLNRGVWFERILPTDGPPVIVGTESIRLILSCDWAEGTDQERSVESLFEWQKDTVPARCWLLKVRWLEFDGDSTKGKSTRPDMIDVDEMSESVDQTMSHRAANSAMEFYVRRQADIIYIKFVKQ